MEFIVSKMTDRELRYDVRKWRNATFKQLSQKNEALEEVDELKAENVELSQRLSQLTYECHNAKGGGALMMSLLLVAICYIMVLKEHSYIAC